MRQSLAIIRKELYLEECEIVVIKFIKSLSSINSIRIVNYITVNFDEKSIYYFVQNSIKNTLSDIHYLEEDMKKLLFEKNTLEDLETWVTKTYHLKNKWMGKAKKNKLINEKKDIYDKKLQENEDKIEIRKISMNLNFSNPLTSL